MLAAAWVTAIATLLLALGVPLTFATWLGTRRADRMREQREQERALTNAIAQLGSHNQQVRADGVYALERVARESVRDYPRVMEVLTTFIREHSRREGPQSVTDEPSTEAPKFGSGTDASHRVTRPDVQAAITVIGRRDTQRDGQPIDLTGLDLTGLDLTGLDLTGLDLAYANLARANLAGANLANANLTRANLAGAILYGADLTAGALGEANLRGADVRSAALVGADLYYASLIDAILYGADLTGANLTGADLTGAHLDQVTDANLTNANFAGARWVDARPVPDGWMRDPISDMLKRADSDADDAG
jgi:uncharacterized protein YjbI with pentapeptide repeats